MEISIALVIIGIMIVGIIQGQSLINKSSLATARSLTQDSTVQTISNLVLWLDATQEGALTNTNDSTSVEDNDYIKSWTDRNMQLSTQLTFSNNITNRYPSYTESAINRLPALYFDGADDGTGDYLYTANDPRITKPDQFTIFVVFKPVSGYSTTDTCLGILTKQTGTEINLGGAINNPPYSVCFIQTLNKFGGTVVRDNNTSGATGNLNSSSTANDNSIHANNSYIGILSHKSTSGSGLKSILNGSYYRAVSGLPNISSTAGNLVIGGQKIGSNGRFFKGYIGEIIMYNRALNDEEANSVLIYLGQKWQIKVSQMTQF